MALTQAEKVEMILLREEMDRRAAQNQLARYAPYPKQMEFHENGRRDQERLLQAGNQLGKTRGAGAETAMHLTGRYPGPGEIFWPTEDELRARARAAEPGTWELTEALGFLEHLGERDLFGCDVYPNGWPGRRFSHPIAAWVAGKSGRETRDIVQAILLGDPEDPEKFGTGMIPLRDIVEGSVTRISGLPNAIDTVMVKHKSGGRSRLGFKTYDQGRERWQGTKKHLVWFDEEPPLDVYTEGRTRTNAANGMVMVTFTPLKGMSGVVRHFLDG